MMTDKTKQAILDAALKIFSKEGYKSATTLSIAEESGFTEMTLFRKFKTKENLFDEAMLKNYDKLKQDFYTMVNDLDQKFDDSMEFLDAYVKTMDKYFSENFEFIRLLVKEPNKINLDIEQINKFTCEFLERNIVNRDIDIQTLGFSINTFLYGMNIDIYHGRKIHEADLITRLIANLKHCI